MKRLLLLPLLLTLGCATAQKSTMMAELTLAKTVSLGYSTLDNVNKLEVDTVRGELVGGKVAKARTDWDAYKAKEDKIRAALAAGDDVLTGADAVRVKASTGVVSWTDYSAFLPALASATAKIEQLIADIKGMLQP